MPASPTPAPGSDFALPEFGPLVPDRPGIGIAGRSAAAPLAYAGAELPAAGQAIAALADTGLDAAAVATLNERHSRSGYIAVGTYGDERTAAAIGGLLEAAGRVVIEADADNGQGFAVSLYPDGRLGADDMLRAAWAAGATEAFPVRE